MTWWAAALGGLTYWFWQRFIPTSPDEHGLSYFLGLGQGRAAESWLNLAIGVLAALTLPAMVRFGAGIHSGAAKVLLCSRAMLQHEVARVATGRSAARAAEASSMRRLERDIHDGPQQRLVRLGMDLGIARHRLQTDPAAAAELLDQAVVRTQQTVAELRALSKGVAPPLLVDRGLKAAVEELAAQSTVPVACRIDVPRALAPHIETAAYFVIAEALTNVAKHSGASQATVVAADAGDELHVAVGDDGHGGAHLGKGLGLAGLQQRVQSVDGVLTVDSPEGGPTLLVASIPLVAEEGNGV